MPILAVDVGGTKLAAGLVSEAGELLARRETPTVEGTDADVLFGALAELVQSVDLDGATHVGVGCGGPMDKGGEHVSPLNIPAWRAFPLRGAARRAHRPSGVRRQRREGARAR